MRQATAKTLFSDKKFGFDQGKRRKVVELNDATASVVNIHAYLLELIAASGASLCDIYLFMRLVDETLSTLQLILIAVWKFNSNFSTVKFCDEYIQHETDAVDSFVKLLFI